MTPPEILVTAAGVYLALGFLFAIPFAWVGSAKVDPDARGASWGFRLLVIPGAALLWPLMAKRWATAAQPPEGPPAERTPHKRAIQGGDS